MQYWLIKSEPNTWSWNDQTRLKTTMWDGVRNYQARNNLMKMKVGDLCFFYHSMIGKEILGIVIVTKEHYPDPTDKTNKFVVVDVAYKKTFINPITLKFIKNNKKLQSMPLIKQSRLSVMPIDKKSCKLICSFGNKVNG